MKKSKRYNLKKGNSSQKAKDAFLNFFYNFLIVVLSVLVVYMSYSIYLKLFGSSEDLNTNLEEGIPSDIIQVEVLNGCGVNGIADTFTDYLRKNKFDVVNTANYHSFNEINTMVIDRIGNLANAKKIAEALGVPKASYFSQLNNNYFVDVTVIIGKDYHKLNPLKKE
ncbi:MAG: LytR C-terminal domain-containing protein [Ignavibacteria bacterium]|jgi:hypothetical protein